MDEVSFILPLMLRGCFAFSVFEPVTRSAGLVSAFRCKNTWTDDPLKKAALGRRKPVQGLGNKIWSGKASDFPKKPIEHSGSPYTIEHPKGIPSTFLDANKMKDNPGSHHSRKIVGRGPGSGLGKTAGRGTKGQKSRSG